MTLQYIQRALNATSSAIRLEREAERLGLEQCTNLAISNH